jgi:lysophospholipase L1-like esterase
MGRLDARAAALAAGGFLGLVAVEAMLAFRREYLPTEPRMDLDGEFGDAAGEPLVFVVLGDSTSAGVGAGAPDRTYPVLLARRLAAGGGRVRLVNLGVPGARVGDVLDHQVPAAEAASPDLVFVGIGGNDATHVTPIASVRRDMEAVLARLQRTGAGIAVAGPPDMRAAAFLQPLRSLSGWRGRRVAGAIERVAVQRRAAVVPLAAATRAFVSSHPERYFSEDGFHPGARGYAAWADAIAPVLEAVLAARR